MAGVEERARKGRGPRFLLIGGALLLVLAVAALSLWGRDIRREWLEASVAGEFCMIQMALVQYREDHDGALPPSLWTLEKEYLPEIREMRSPEKIIYPWSPEKCPLQLMPGELRWKPLFCYVLPDDSVMIGFEDGTILKRRVRSP